MPIEAPAPGTFSTTTGWPRISESFCATGRENESVGPPGGKGTIQRIGLLGKVAAVWAFAECGNSPAPSAPIAPIAPSAEALSERTTARRVCWTGG